MKNLHLIVASTLVLLPSLAFAETIELVTYYPAAASGNFERLHAGRATIGDPYSLGNPTDLPNGTLLVAGPVGIGTAAPQYMLHVMGNVPAGGGGVGRARITVESTTAGVAGIHIGHLPVNAGAPTDRQWATIGYNDNSDVLRINNFSTFGDNHLVITPNGNVGIGTAAPTTGLEVKSSLYPVIRSIRSSTDAGGQSGALMLKKLTSNAGMNDGFGIGVDFAIEDATSGEQAIAGLGAVRDGANNSGALNFYTVTAGITTERMRILTGGNVGIGTLSPQTTSPTNNVATGNLDVNDIYVRSLNKWLSQSTFPPAVAKVYGKVGQGIPAGWPGTIMVFANNPGNFESSPGMIDIANSAIKIQADGVYEISTSCGCDLAGLVDIWIFLRIAHVPQFPGDPDYFLPEVWFEGKRNVSGSELFNLRVGDWIHMGLYTNTAAGATTEGNTNGWEKTPRLSVKRVG